MAMEDDRTGGATAPSAVQSLEDQQHEATALPPPERRPLGEDGKPLLRFRFSCDERGIQPWMRPLFMRNDVDDAMEIFLRNCLAAHRNWLLQHWHNLAIPVLSRLFGFSRTSVNGILGRGRMFILSSGQLQSLLQNGAVDPVTPGSKDLRMLDIGAGDGNVTAQLAKVYGGGGVDVTEADIPMRWRLWSRGYRLLSVENWEQEGHGSYNLIACLNVLDRCDKPLDLLRSMRDKLAPNGAGILLLGVVLPFKPFVEKGSRRLMPSQSIKLHGKTWEAHLDCLVRHTLMPLGFRLRSFCRAPYLCEGDLWKPHYVLDDCVLVLSADDQ